MIHYHGTPLSGGERDRMALSGRHACVSYAAPRDLPMIAEICQSFILDNGAFSAWTKGVAFDLDGFMSWAELWRRHPACDWMLAPDVIDGSEADNNALLADCVGPEWVPVWHLHESIGRLERLCNEWQRVAFGSSGEFAKIGTAAWWARMDLAMSAATDSDGRPLAKFHGLRMLDPTVFSRFPFSSADSTNVARNIGIDQAWTGSYAPASKHTRALILMERIERHAAASRYFTGASPTQNIELFG